MIAPKFFPPEPNWGPVTRRAFLRSALIYVVLLTVGFGLAVAAPWTALQVFGLGLVFPGAGFLFWFAGENFQAYLHLALCGASLLGFATCVFVWFATGNVLAPVGFWILSAVAAALMAHVPIWAGAPRAAFDVLIVLFSVVVIARQLLRLHGRRQRRCKNAYLAKQPFIPPNRAPREVGLEDLQRLRVLLDRALQPLEKFNGFEKLDQFQTAAMRYQLNFMGYGLSLFQHSHASAFQSYLSQAQHNLIAKQQQHSIWSYWALENAWGNLKRSADPMGRDNIMFTGFVATQIALFHAASGRNDFDRKNSLSFQVPNGPIFHHDFPKMAATLAQNFGQSEYTLMACEPNWIYPLCNGIGAAALCFHNPKLWRDLAPKFSDQLDREFLSASGAIVPCRSSYLGAALPAAGGAVVQSFPCFYLNAVLPDVARRHWLIERQSMLTNGKLRNARFWPVDFGNYRLSPASSLAATAAAAREMGDDEVAELLLQRLDQTCPTILNNGVSHRPKASLWAHGAEAMARFGNGNAFAGLIAAGNGQRAELPHVAHAEYPDVLVAHAKATVSSLHCIFYPGEKPSQQTIAIAGLKPLAKYKHCDSAIFSDAAGRAQVTLTIDGRTVFDLCLLP